MDRSYLTGEVRPEPRFIPDEQYGEMIAQLPRPSADCLVISPDGRILLGDRVSHPWPTWWIIGGRQQIGEGFAEAAQRNIKRELRLDLSQDRFEDQLKAYSLIWPTRQIGDKVEEIPCHDISVVMVLPLTLEEIDSINAPDGEFDQLRWLSPEEILHGDYHPSIQQMIRDYLARSSAG
jgi:ADP-ribose pyrophosphatase YjhB (NUDIX family)